MSSLILSLIILLFIIGSTVTQEPTVLLNQGAIIGVKIFPEPSRVPIDAYLGIPYATPPIGRLRFSAPEKHKGWKRTLYAQEFGPSCLQYREKVGNKPNSEDCLYLNIWTPQNAQKIGKLPVMVVFQTETFNEDLPVQLPGEDLAAEGLIVVTANHRLNIFGFYCLGSSEARGNLGLLDQYFVLLWIKENIVKFGGDPGSITLFGHSSGAASVLYHIISPRTKSLFHKAIMMSENTSTLWKPSSARNASRTITSNIGCSSDSVKESVQCLRERPADELMKVFRTLQNGNLTNSMTPIKDDFLLQTDRYLPLHPIEALTSGNFHQIPILIGITSLEAADSRDQWESLARQGYHQLKHYVDFTAIPTIMDVYKLTNNPRSKFIKELIKWNYIEANDGDAWGLLQQLRQMYSEALYDAPHERLISHLSKSSQPLYAYRYHHIGGIDLYGKKGNYSGAAHGSDLPYLFGPTLFKQLVRRRMTQQEERLSKRMRIMWSEFVKFGYPISNHQYDSWKRYTNSEKYTYKIGDDDNHMYRKSTSFWNTFLPKLTNMTLDSILNERQTSDSGNDTIKHAMYTLLGLVIALVILLVVCVVLLKRSVKERQRERETGSF